MSYDGEIYTTLIAEEVEDQAKLNTYNQMMRDLCIGYQRIRTRVCGTSSLNPSERVSDILIKTIGGVILRRYLCPLLISYSFVDTDERGFEVEFSQYYLYIVSIITLYIVNIARDGQRQHYKIRHYQFIINTILSTR